ncbi:carbon-nitrogen hydrolase family protein [Microbacterium sp. YY-01]|uniref:carbon-nitrogen hydrolase family protein n=1 Tax=Microbacterium sp. YY-01 TaxID=3421634 RepID=UPI003D171E67
MLAVAVCQFAPTDDVADNRQRMSQFTRDAVQRGAQLVVFPEYSNFFVNPIDGRLAQNAEPLDGPFVQHLQQLAGEHAVTIVAGLIEVAQNSGAGGGDQHPARVHNTAVAVTADGVVATHRKQHLYDAFGQRESQWIAPGPLTTPETFVVAGFTIGVMTCYDLRFPEVARTLTDAGADVFIVPAEWVRGPLKEHHWQTLLAARAIENTAYVVAADHPTPIGVGHSAVVDPQGVTIAAVSTHEGIALAHLDTSEIARVREVNPALRLRRYRVSPMMRRA